MSDHEIRIELEEVEARVNITVATTDMILERVNRILYLLLKRNTPTGMVINQIGGNTVSTQAGTTSNFQQFYTPNGSVPPAGTTQTWTVDISDIVLTPSADGTTCQAAVPAAETATSYNLTCTSSFMPAGAPTPISATINVPIIINTPTPTGMTITQLS